MSRDTNVRMLSDWGHYFWKTESLTFDLPYINFVQNYRNLHEIEIGPARMKFKSLEATDWSK